ncbi:MAG: hypothetical protein ACI4TL_01175 [Candidatus Cryptobacteroides sp.]
MVTRVVESGSVVSDAVKEYGYDYAGRLVEEMVDGESKEFSYDARGNILSDGRIINYFERLSFLKIVFTIFE